jgi:signal transduction histidine kinase
MKIRIIFKNGLSRLKENPQLFYTLAVALAVIIGFFTVSYLFISIASSAQDRLVNVRLGSLHDGFAVYATKNLQNGEELSETIEKISSKDQTLRDFQVVALDADSNIRKVVADSNINDQDFASDYDFFYDFASGSPGTSFTFPIEKEGERQFVTVRALERENGSGIAGWILTRQTLSEADKNIDRSLLYSGLIGFIILIIILLLFFRQARIVDYIALYQKMEDASKMKDDFLSMAAHELRTPLTAIRGYVEFLQEEQRLSETGRKSLDIVALRSGELSDLITDMLDVAKIQQGKLPVNKTILDPVDVIMEIFELLEAQAKLKNLNLETETEGGFLIRADKERLGQVIVNLASNSIKYTQKGEVRISLKKDMKDVIITISDTGIGIGGEDQKHLFEKFYRVKGKETEGIVGTGLGLWISKQLIALMG